VRQTDLQVVLFLGTGWTVSAVVMRASTRTAHAHATATAHAAATAWHKMAIAALSLLMAPGTFRPPTSLPVLIFLAATHLLCHLLNVLTFLGTTK
jgi:hypothetical protein